MSGFGTLNTAVSGLTAAQRAMDVAGQNVVNANTPGYSRQRVLLETQGPVSAATYFTRTAANFGGVTVQTATRVHDAFVEATRTSAGGRQAALTAQTSTLTGAQQLFSEPSETGLQNTMDAFYSAWHDLSNSPTDSSAGSVVLQRGIAVTDQLHYVSDGLSQQWATARSNLADVVTQTNQATSDLANLNGKIMQASVGGQPLGELLDRRDTLVRSLSNLVGAAATPGQDDQVSVSVNGITVVSGTDSFALSLSGGTDVTTAAASPPMILWGTTSVPIESGSAAGYLATLRTDLPNLLTHLDSVATALRDAVNLVHQTGYTTAGDTGTDFFSGTTARTLAVVPTVPSALAIAANAGVVDGSIAMKIGDLANDQTVATTLSGADGPSVLWRNLTSSFGVQVQSLQAAGKVQDAVVAAADSASQADSGVSLDEEMTSMLLYQRSYQASARVITTIDEMLDTLVNRTGTVGR